MTPAPESQPRPEYRDVDGLLAAARSGLARLDPAAAVAAVTAGARLVDIRPAWQRAREGEIPGALIVERNHLEWRLHPGSGSRLPAAEAGQRWIVVCSEGYTSSLAAAALNSIGVPATDLVGGVLAWKRAGQPVTATLTRDEDVVGAGSSLDSVSVDRGDLAGPHVEDEARH